MIAKLSKIEAVDQWVGRLTQIPVAMLKDISDLYPQVSYELTMSDDEPDGRFPSWGYVWQFKDRTDNEWLERHIEEVSDCGFRIFKTFYGYFLGIDGGGYDFYEHHWIPLYDARGMHWHTEE